MVCKIIFCCYFSDILDKAGRSQNEEENSRLQGVLRFTQTKQGVQGLQAFAFSVVNVNDKHTKPRFKKRHRG